MLARVRSEGGYPDYYADPREIWLVQLPTDDGLGDLFTYRIVGNPDEENTRGEKTNNHGTLVASVAAGSKYGVAPGATLVADMVSRLSPDAIFREGIDRFWDDLYQVLSKTVLTTDERELRGFFDTAIGEAITADYDEADVINRSYGIPSWSNFNLRNQVLDAAIYWRDFARNFPKSSSALKQLGVAEADKTLVVTAAGNDSDWASPRGLPAVSALEAVYHRELRGLSFAVAALGTDGGIADYSNWCGALPTSGTYAWDAARDGRHYCLSAPGSVNAYDVDGNEVTVQGTSFAAPMVSGALALMMEHFRGQMTPRQIGLRMVNTANNEGRYEEDRIYGAGVLDLDAALSPVGTVATGTPTRDAPLAETVMVTPAAWGDAMRGLGSVEVAGFDSFDGAPFWFPLVDRFASPGTRYTPPEPLSREAFAEDAVLPHLAWAEPPAPKRVPPAERWGVRYSLGPTLEPGLVPSAFGVSLSPPRRAVRFGLVVEDGAVQGARTAGAFGSSPRSSIAFVVREHEHAFGRSPFSVGVSWTVGAGRADYPDGGMFEQTGSSLYSAGEVSVRHRGAGSRTKVALGQPLRAETGKGKVRFPVGRMLDGGRIYDSREVSLVPDAREVRLTVRHDRETGERSALVLEAGHAFDAGHVAGARASFAGAGYQVKWQ